MRIHLKDRQRYVFIAGITMLIQFLLFKYLYPFPNFMQDSYNYLRSTYTNADANMWPVGYAKLVRFVGFFSHSDTLLVFVQYLCYHCCALYFFFTILDLTPSGKWAKATIFAFLFLNPAILYLSNYITSDVYFISISLVWISQLFKLIYKPGRLLLLAHLLVLLLAFTVRYHALIYPVISITVIVFCGVSVRTKLASIIAIITLISGFIYYTTGQTGKVMGTRQFSAFSGWQMASNAVYAYAHMPVRPVITVPSAFAAVHQRVTIYLDSLQHIPMAFRPDRPLMAFYLWDPGSPLQPVPGAAHIADNKVHLERMAAVSPLYNKYGKYLINQYPLQYIRYYIWPNMLQYANPPAENMSVYNDGADSVWSIAQTWFRYKTDKVYTVSDKSEMRLFDYYSAFMVFIIILFTGVWIAYLLIGGRKFTAPAFRQAFRMTTFYWIVHFGFSVLASPVVLRYQLFNMILGVTFSILLVDMYLKRARLG
ncbi:hypothetical protein GO495_29085 [Chitinophaga oryziterrae]|uniref:Glycosyltransferase RgtA/B/C/D-like domain-containing protein n=1 Tax=Chitinophaga oryziterrae TaxID=1031224 RepID=A0A6N8JHF2_9BACT|nr:hypothetical protein [Chitinophaga oryziterrae]MVT44683.1 hypothetical protein [Chitinophaga oryziterrae]